MKIVDNNTNVSSIKLCATLMVMLCHSYPLTGKGSDFLVKWTNGKLGLGFVAVSIFFVYSGFFLSKTLEKNDNTWNYLRKRVERIFPPLVTFVIITVLIIGPMFTTYSYRDYFTNEQTYLYFLNALLIPIHGLPGVFISAPYNSTINGSLWTLPVEFGCYIFLLVLYKLKNKYDKRLINVLLIGLVFFICPLGSYVLKNTSFSILASAISPFSMFCMGHLYWEMKDRITGNVFAVILEAIVLFVTLNSIYFSTFWFVLVFPLFLLTISNMDIRMRMKEGVWRKNTYELYLWGFPIGQMIVEVFPDISVLNHFIGTVLVDLLVVIFIKRIVNILKK